MPVITPDPQGDRSVLKDAYTQVFRIVSVGHPVDGVALVTCQITSPEEYPLGEIAAFDDEGVSQDSADSILDTASQGTIMDGEGSAGVKLMATQAGAFVFMLRKATAGSIWLSASAGGHGYGPYACYPRKLEVVFP